ncbi:MAG: hypothetical protein QOK14_1847 [Frankiaceae bacterium]|nr:hypothetical protein [Frankiaceae bacterium]
MSRLVNHSSTRKFPAPWGGRNFPAVAAAAVAAAAASLALAGCTSRAATTATPSAVASFHVQEGFQPSSASQPCLLHQTDAPTNEFMGGPSASPGLQLPFMAYLRANGNKAFCDGTPPTDIDKKWAVLYVTLTDNAADVAAITK